LADARRARELGVAAADEPPVEVDRRGDDLEVARDMLGDFVRVARDVLGAGRVLVEVVLRAQELLGLGNGGAV
jgi:hypothetical protein